MSEIDLAEFDLRPCPRCETTLRPPSQDYCNSCKNAINRQWEAKKPEASRDKARQRGRRRYHRESAKAEADPVYKRQRALKKNATEFKGRIRRKYGITVEEYEAMLIAQQGTCAICKERPMTKLAIDHDHRTGKVRGLLCDRCNIGIGCLRDDPVRLKAAIKYLC